MVKQTLRSRIKNGWNAFRNRDPTVFYNEPGMSYSYRPDRPRFSAGNERTIATSVFNKIAMDVASIDIRHCKIDENGRYLEDMKSDLNNCLTTETNIDQAPTAFKREAVLSMFDEGVVALVPVIADGDITTGKPVDIRSIRTGKLIQWFPTSVKLEVYNELTGLKEMITLPKQCVAIIENPLYPIINEPNSTFKRLNRKLALLDAMDEQMASGKLDLIIQLPYTVKGTLRQEAANKRKEDIIEQLQGPYGIAYLDATEKITQLNRPIENNLLKHVEYLTNTFYDQIGVTAAILNGTADESTMLNYQKRLVEPIATAFVEAMRRAFLTDEARNDCQTIMAFRDPFKYTPVNTIAEIADKFTRNEIMTANEIRQVIGMKPSKDPKADELRNSNISKSKEEAQQTINSATGEVVEQGSGETT